MTAIEILTSNENYTFSLLTRHAHHSCAIENNPLTLADAEHLIRHASSPGQVVSMRHLIEVYNYKDLLDYLVYNARDRRVFNTTTFKEIHYILTGGLIYGKERSGEYKKKDNYVVTAEFQKAYNEFVAMQMFEKEPLSREEIANIYNELLVKYAKHTTPPKEVAGAMARMVDTLLDNDLNTLETICKCHLDFENIHPFVDGNGRVGRAVMLYLTLLFDEPLFVITKEQKEEYMAAVKENSLDRLVKLCRKMQKDEKEFQQKLGII